MAVWYGWFNMVDTKFVRVALSGLHRYGFGTAEARTSRIAQ